MRYDICFLKYGISMPQIWSSQLPAELSAHLRPWLAKTYSLHRQLKASTAEVSLTLLSQGKESLSSSEIHTLNTSKGWVREICHTVKADHVIYGRVAIPADTYELMQKELAQLGDRPIGDTLLFHHRGVRRGKFEYAQIDAKDPDYQSAFKALKVKSGTLWARRSIFYWYEHPFIITEIFVEDRLPKCVRNWAASVPGFRLKTKLLDYLYLIRLHRPLPILLLLWPVYWALWIASAGFPSLKYFVIFTLGVIVMRSAGDIFNDLADRKLDKAVERTKLRPLATGRVSVKEALGLAFVLSFIALVLVLFLNPLCWVLAIVGFGLAVAYPWCKRVTHFPQVVLGLAYNWGIPMVFAAVQNRIPLIAWLLLILTVLWTVVYDTMYALADRQYDLQTGIKSTAVIFGRYAERIIAVLQVVFLIGMAFSGWYLQLSLWYYVALVLSVPFFIFQHRLLPGYEIKNCIRAFANNHWVGLLIWVGILLSYVYSIRY